MSRDQITHELISYPESFTAILSGQKTSEFRRAYRNFQVGDTFKLLEYDTETQAFTGRFVVARISHVEAAPNFDIPEASVVLSFKGAIDQDGRVIR